MQHQLMSFLLIIVPLVGVAQKGTNKTLKEDYAATVKEFESSLQKSDSLEQLFQPKATSVKDAAVKLLEKRATLMLRKEQVLNVYRVMESTKKPSELPFTKEAVHEVRIPDVRAIADPIVKILDDPANLPMSWPLDSASNIHSVEFAELSVKEQNESLIREISYLKEKIRWINSRFESKLAFLPQLDEAEKQLKVFSVEMDVSQQKMDRYYADLVKDDGTGEDEVPVSMATPMTKKEVQSDQPSNAPVVYSFTDEPAEFPGGKEALKAFFEANLKIPEVAIRYKIEGKAYMQFVVSAQGNISNVKAVRGVPNCVECDIEAERVIRSMPKWIPGKNNGKPVNSVFNLPVAFKLPK
jgi:protein TonB